MKFKLKSVLEKGCRFKFFLSIKSFFQNNRLMESKVFLNIFPIREYRILETANKNLTDNKSTFKKKRLLRKFKHEKLFSIIIFKK